MQEDLRTVENADDTGRGEDDTDAGVARGVPPTPRRRGGGDPVATGPRLGQMPATPAAAPPVLRDELRQALVEIHGRIDAAEQENSQLRRRHRVLSDQFDEILVHFEARRFERERDVAGDGDPDEVDEIDELLACIESRRDEWDDRCDDDDE